MADLLITASDGTNREVALSDSVVLGRDATCDVLLDDLGTSRRHARVKAEGDGYVVEDLGSKNGTLLNGVRCSVARLANGDEIVLGTVHVLFRDATASAEPTTSVVVSDQGGTDVTTHYSNRSHRMLLPQQRLEMLYDLSARLTRLRDRQDLLDDVLTICFDTLRFERGAIAVKTLDGRGLDWPVVRNLRGVGGELTISQSVLSRALQHGERAVITDAGHAQVDPTVSMVQHGIRSALCVPLQHHDEILGVIYGDRTSTGAVYTEEDVDFLSGLAQQVSIGLINARLLVEQQAKLALEHEITLARDIQQQLFPKNLPEDDRLRVAALNDPGRRVSGDYYDVLELADGRLAFIIADVTGEGVSAALLMANLQAAVRVTLPRNDDLGALFGLWNSLIYHNTDASKFITALAGIVDSANHKLTVANAGHLRPFMLAAGVAEPQELQLEAAFPLGIWEDTRYETEIIELPSAGTLFTFTDGVVEAMNSEDELFTEKRLAECLAAAESHEPRDLNRRVRREVERFSGGAPQSDDITMLALQFCC